MSGASSQKKAEGESGGPGGKGQGPSKLSFKTRRRSGRRSVAGRGKSLQMGMNAAVGKKRNQ